VQEILSQRPDTNTSLTGTLKSARATADTPRSRFVRNPCHENRLRTIYEIIGGLTRQHQPRQRQPSSECRETDRGAHARFRINTRHDLVPVVRQAGRRARPCIPAWMLFRPGRKPNFPLPARIFGWQIWVWNFSTAGAAADEARAPPQPFLPGAGERNPQPTTNGYSRVLRGLTARPWASSTPKRLT